MRELKFRAWHVTNYVMYDPSNEIGGLWSIPESPNGVVKYGDNILMQYTGLKDKNGKEIYEGDVLEYIPYNKAHVHAEVRFGEFDAFWPTGEHGYSPAIGFYAVIGESEYSLIQMYSTKIDGTPFETIEVIGNIHSNPELL